MQRRRRQSPTIPWYYINRPLVHVLHIVIIAAALCRKYPSVAIRRFSLVGPWLYMYMLSANINIFIAASDLHNKTNVLYRGFLAYTKGMEQLCGPLGTARPPFKNNRVKATSVFYLLFLAEVCKQTSAQLKKTFNFQIIKMTQWDYTAQFKCE